MDVHYVLHVKGHLKLKHVNIDVNVLANQLKVSNEKTTQIMNENNSAVLKLSLLQLCLEIKNMEDSMKWNVIKDAQNF